MARRTDGASIMASFDPSALMRTAQALRIGAMENKAARWIRRGSFMFYLFSGWGIGSCDVGCHCSGASGILRIFSRSFWRFGSHDGTNISPIRIRFFPCEGVANTSILVSAVTVVFLRTTRHTKLRPRHVGYASRRMRSYTRSALSREVNPLVSVSYQAPPLSDAWMWYRIVVFDFVITSQVLPLVRRLSLSPPF